jgi:cell wall-associated NlpC family hydrolase
MTSCNDCHPLAKGPVVTTLAPDLVGPRLDIAARKYLGVPFLHQGRDPAVGIDCVGLLVNAAKDCGLHDLAAHDFTAYARNPARGELERRVAAALTRVFDAAPGDVVTLAFFGQTRHVGIIGHHGNRLTLIHTYNSPAKVIEHGLDDQWRRRITGIYRAEASA